MNHGSWVTGQLTDGSRWSWIIKCDPLSAPIPAARRSGVFRVVGERQRQRDDRVGTTCRPHLRPNVQEYRRQRRHFEQSADATSDVTAGRRRWYLVPAQLRQVQLSTVLRPFCESFFCNTTVSHRNIRAFVSCDTVVSVRSCLAESNDSYTAGFMASVTCGLTAEDRDQLGNHTFVLRLALVGRLEKEVVLGRQNHSA